MTNVSSAKVRIFAAKSSGSGTSTNARPTVSVTSPANNAVFVAPATIPLTATAADDGSVTQVEFFAGTTSLGVDSSSPYGVTWNSVSSGSYSVTARATDNFGLITTSAVVRTAVTNVDGSRWAYGYDRLGQVTNGWRYWSDGNDVLGQTFNYAFDDIGNRKSAGTGTPGAQRTQTYSMNLLNQYTNRTVPGFVEVNGSADAAAVVTVNAGAVSRQGEYFRQRAWGHISQFNNWRTLFTSARAAASRSSRPSV